MYSIITITLSPIFEVQSQSPLQQFAYLVIDIDDSASVNLIDPNTLESRTLIPIPMNTGEYISAAFLSPTSEWLVIHFVTEGRFPLRLLDLSSSEIVDVIDDVMFPPRPLTLGSDFNIFAWSPSGQYFAFHAQSSDSGQSIYLYDMQSQTLSNLRTADENQYQLSWSPNSDQLAVMGLTCRDDGCSYAQLSVYNPANALLTNSFDLTAYSRNSFSESVNFCEVHWSRDSAYISFLDYCDGSSIGTPRELQIIQIASQRVIPVTNLTPTAIPPERSLFNVALDTIWIDNQNLFIGVSLVEGEIFVSGTTSVYTLNYNVSTQAVSMVDSRRLGKWARANNHLIGYLAYQYSDDPDRGLSITGANIEIARFDGHILIPQATGPSGCNLSWNRAADTLAYIARDVAATTLCEPAFETLNFLTINGLRSFAPTQDTIALGWFTTER